MTHKDIYTKFMIEYDKANVTSSYPSLTEYEVATVLDKAYNALIAQKVTGNNLRRVPLEGDLKSIEDLSPLIINDIQSITYNPDINIISCNIPNTPGKEMLYFVSAFLKKTFPKKYVYGRDIDILLKRVDINGITLLSYMVPTRMKGLLFYNDDINPEQKFAYRFYSGDNALGNWEKDTLENISSLLSSSIEIIDGAYKSVDHIAIIPYKGNTSRLTIIPSGSTSLTGKIVMSQTTGQYDGINPRPVPIKLVNHEIADRFVASSYNMPWIKIPVCYIEHGKMYVVYDPISTPDFNSIYLTYIKQPNKFAKDLQGAQFEGHRSDISYFYVNENERDDIKQLYEFECNDTVAEELISLAISFALENIESPRLNSKLNMRGLEA